MQTVSQAWKEAQRQTIVPESFVEITIGVGDPEAQEKAVCSDNGHEHFSQTEKLTDEGRKTTVKYATLEPGIWVLDGSARLIERMKPDVPDIPDPPEVIIYTVTLSATPMGSGSAEGGGEAEEGSEVTIIAVPEEGCEFSAWMENGEIVSESAEYTFTISADRTLTAVFTVLPREYAYTGEVVTTILPPGRYKLELWGAEGGYRSRASYAGKGGYATGELLLMKPTRLFARVGGSGNTGGPTGGFNGGGQRATYNGGGGASDIRLEVDDLFHRVIVAGGGGSDGAANKAGGYGGGETGQSRTDSYGTGGFGGTQTGVSNSSWQTDTPSENTSSKAGAYAGFGFGGNGISLSGGHPGAGGGGWYGGSGSVPDSSGDDDRGGGGGSGFVWTGGAVPEGFALTLDDVLDNALTKGGNLSFLSPTGASETGHSGDGYIRITPMS